MQRFSYAIIVLTHLLHSLVHGEKKADKVYVGMQKFLTAR